MQSECIQMKSFKCEEIGSLQERISELQELHIKSSLPKGFQFDDNDWLTFQEDKEADPSLPIRICSRLEIVARTRDQFNEKHGRLLKFTDPDGIVHHWSMPMELLAGDGTSYRQELLSKGLLIASGNKARQLLTTYIQVCIPDKTIRCVEQTGWSKDLTAFVLNDETIGECGNEPLILQTTFGSSAVQSISGDLEDWQQLACLCKGNPKLIFSLSIAFAPPLQRLFGIENGGFHFRGHSSSGKTTCLRVAASVWGGSDFLKQWRATANGLEGACVSHNDCLMCLDEMGQMDPTEIGKVAYMLANGVGKTRADKLGNARTKASWRLLFLSSGEISLTDHLQEAKQKAKAGQEIRILDIPSDNGIFGCFDVLHGFEQPNLFAEHLTELSRKYYGVAGRQFIRSILKDKEAIIKKCKFIMLDFIKKCLPKNASSQIDRALNRFALAAAAGELATLFGITGWEEGVALKGAMDCFNDWLSARGNLGLQEEQQVLSHVRHFFEQHGESRFSPWRLEEESLSSKTVLRAGFRKPIECGEEFFVFREAFKKDLCLGFDHVFVAKVCLRNELLIPGPSYSPTRSERLPGSKKTTRVYRFSSKVLVDGE